MGADLFLSSRRSRTNDDRPAQGVSAKSGLNELRCRVAEAEAISRRKRGYEGHRARVARPPGCRGARRRSIRLTQAPAGQACRQVSVRKWDQAPSRDRRFRSPRRRRRRGTPGIALGPGPSAPELCCRSPGRRLATPCWLTEPPPVSSTLMPVGRSSLGSAALLCRRIADA